MVGSPRPPEVFPTHTFLVCPDLRWERGQCFSCGDKLGAPRYGRCWRCHLAWRWAAGLFDRMVDGRTTQTVTDEDEVAHDHTGAAGRRRRRATRCSG